MIRRFRSEARFRLRGAWQYLTKGYADSELWNLDTTIARFLLPRVRRFASNTHSYPSELTEQQWAEILNEIRIALEVAAKGEYWDLSKEEHERVQRGFELLGKWFQNLWD